MMMREARRRIACLFWCPSLRLLPWHCDECGSSSSPKTIAWTRHSSQAVTLRAALLIRVWGIATMRDHQDREQETEDCIVRMAEVHGPRLRGVARRLGVRTPDDEDIAQAVLLEALRFLSGGGTLDRDKEWAWLRKVAHSESLMWRRRRNGDDKRRRVRVEFSALPSDRDPTFSDVMRKEREEAVRRALDALPADARRAVVACDCWEQMVTEFGRYANISRKAAERCRNRGRRLLRRKLKGHEADFRPQD